MWTIETSLCGPLRHLEVLLSSQSFGGKGGRKESVGRGPIPNLRLIIGQWTVEVLCRWRLVLCRAGDPSWGIGRGGGGGRGARDTES